MKQIHFFLSLLCAVSLLNSTAAADANEMRVLFRVEGTAKNPTFLEVLHPDFEAPPKGRLELDLHLPLQVRAEPRRFDVVTFDAHLRRVFQQFGRGTPVFFQIQYYSPVIALRPALATASDCGARNIFVLLDLDGHSPPYKCTRLRVEGGALDELK